MTDRRHKTGRAAMARGVLALAVLLLSAAAARGQEGPQPEVFYGFGGFFRSHCWTPVLVQVPQGFAGGSFQGMGYVQPSGNCDAPRGRFQAPVTLTAAEGAETAGVERFWLYVRPGNGLFSGSAYLQGPRRYDLFTDLRLPQQPLADVTTVILVAGRSLGLETVIGGEVLLPNGDKFKPFAAQYETVHCDLRELPDRAIGYEAIDVLVLVNPEVGRELRDDQLEAVVQFVETGGRLVLWVNRHWQETARSRLADILPARLGPLSPLTDLKPLQAFAGLGADVPAGEVTVPAVAPRPGSTVRLASGGAPVVVESPVGLGSVTLVCLDTGSPAIRSWRSVPQFTGGLVRLMPDLPAEGPELLTAYCGERAERLARPRAGFGSLAFFWAVILMTLGYILIGGPVLHLVLKAHKRLNLSWPVYFSLGLATAGACFAIVSLVRNRDVLNTTLTVVDFPADGRAAAGRSLYSLRFPDSSLYDVSLEGKGGYLALKPAQDLSMGLLSSSGRLFDYAETLLALEGLPVKSNQFRYFAARWRTDAAPPVTADLSAGRSAYTGTLSTAYAQIGDAVLVGPQYTYRLGSRLKPGRSLDPSILGTRFTTAEYLQNLAARRRGDETVAPPGLYYGPPEEETPSTNQEAFDDICLATCFEMYRRAPARQGGQFLRIDLRRTGWARSLDLTHLLDDGCAILIGEADLAVPDSLRVDGRPTTEPTRLVIFRQVIPLR